MTLKRIDPGSSIDVLAPAWTFPLLARMPQVIASIALPLMHGQFGLAARIKLGRQLKAQAYDQAIILPNSWKSALIPYFAAIPVRTGYLGECRWGLVNDARSLDKKSLPMTVQRFVALALPAGNASVADCPIPVLTVNSADQQAALARFGLERSGRILALCPGAEYGPAKRWPAQHYAALARLKLDQGWQVWLFGSAKDQEAARQINQATSGLCADFTGRTTLGEAVDLLALADAVVTNDSGLMHVAAALDKKIIALYGSSDPGFTPPLNAQAQIVSLHLPCSPCFKRQCPLYPVDHKDHTQCLAGIRVDQVAKLIEP